MSGLTRYSCLIPTQELRTLRKNRQDKKEVAAKDVIEKELESQKKAAAASDAIAKAKEIIKNAAKNHSVVSR